MPGGFFGWGSPFGRESLDQYRDKERTRSRDLFVDRQLSRPSIASPTRSRDFLSSIGDTVGKSLREVRDASLAPKQISQQPRKGGGGFLSKAKKIGKGALDTLDAAAETTRDLAEPIARRTPGADLAFALSDQLGISKGPGIKGVLDPRRRLPGASNLGLLRDIGRSGAPANLIESRGNPAGFVERQKADLHKRGFADQLLTQTVFDPTNLVGAEAVTKGLRGASVARQGTLTGRLFAGAAKANEIADVAQTKFAREAVGGTLGFTASALSGGDTRQNLEAAGAGVLAGRLSRYVGKQGAEAARIGRAFPVGAQIADETPNIERYTASLDQLGVPWSFDNAGKVVLGPGAEDAINSAYIDAMNKGLAPGRAGGVANTSGEGGTKFKERWGKVKEVSDRGTLGSQITSGDFWRADSPAHDQLDAVERAREALADGAPNPIHERSRSEPWAPGTEFKDNPILPDAERQQLQTEVVGLKSDRKGPAQIKKRMLGIDSANRVISEFVQPGYAFDGGIPRTPARTQRALLAEMERMTEAIRVNQGGKVTAEQKAYLDRLQEAYNAIDAAGHDAGTVASREVAPDAAGAGRTDGAVPDAAGSGSGSVAPDSGSTVKRIGLDGTVTDTFQTEAELAGIKPAQGDLLARGEAEAKRAAMESGAAEPPLTASPAARRKAKIQADAVVAPALESAGVPPAEIQTAFENEGRRLLGASNATREIIPPASQWAPEERIYRVPKEGMLKVSIEPDSHWQNPKVHIAQLYIDPSARRSGVLARLLRTAENDAGKLMIDSETLSPQMAALLNEHPRMQERLYRRTADGWSLLRPAERPLPAQAASQMPIGGEIRKTPKEIPTARPIQDIAPSTPGPNRVFGEASGPDTPASLPPGPPKEPPAPREPGQGNPQRAFGQTVEPVDLLRGKPREDVVAAGEAVAAGKKGALQRIRMGRNPKTRQGVTEGIRQELQRTNHIVNETVGAQVDRVRAKAERAGIRIVPEGDRWVLQGTDQAIEDIVEGSTDAARAVRATLSEDQRAVLDEIQSLNQRWNQTIESHGGEVAKVNTETGDYWSRKVVGREVEGRTVPKNEGGGNRGRSVGGARIGQRSQESVAAGSEAGLVYDNPWEALKGGLRNKARMAQDQYLANMIQPLAEPNAKAGFGYRALRGNHPALEKVKYVGEADSGAALLGRDRLVFPNDIADELDNILAPKSIADTTLGKAIGKVNSVATPFRASADASYVLNQGLGFMQSSPKNAMKALTGSVDVIRSASGNPEVYHAMVDEAVGHVDDVLRQADIQQDGLEYLTQRGMHYVDESAVTELQFPDWVNKLPAVGKITEWSNETFGRFLNYARMQLAGDELQRAVDKGLRGGELDTHMEKALKSINRMTGWSGSEITGLESIAAFAPRFLVSNMEQIAAAFTKGDIEGQIARQHLLKLTAIGGVVTFAVNSARGYNTDIDPRSNNFMRIRNVGGQDISPFGPFSTLIRGAAQTVAGEPGTMSSGPKGRGIVFGTNAPSPFGEGAGVDPLGRFARAKASPVVGLATTLASKRTFDGRPVENNPLDKNFYTGTIRDAAREAIPFSLQAGINQGVEPAIRNRDPKEVIKGLLGAGFSAIGAQSSEVTPSENRDFRRDDVAREKFGKAYADLSGAEKSQVNEDPKIAADQKEAERRQLETGNKATAVAKDFRDKMAANGRYLSAGKDDAGRTFTGNDYRDAYNDAIQQRLGGMKAAGEFQGNDAVSQYYDLFDKASQANGSIDRAKLEQLQAEFRAKNPNIDEQVAKVTGIRDDATLRKFREAKAQAAEYYAIPAYLGMSTEEADRATEVISRAQALSSNGYAPTRKAALAQLVQRGEITQQDMALAIRAGQVGPNPARKRFRTDPGNEAFRTFYQDLTAAEAEQTPTYRGPSSGGGSSTSTPAILSKRSSSTGAAKRRRSSR